MGSSSEDRLCDLPEDVIHKIMSFLSPLEIARLRVLSKRLSLLWLSVPDLTLDSTHPDWLHHQDSFFAHARTTLSRRRRLDPTLRRLSLRLFIVTRNPHHDEWVGEPLLELASDLAVADLSVHVKNRRWPRPYPRFVFSSPWLSSVKLTGLFLPVREFLVACPLLRHFHLHSCDGGDGFGGTTIRFSPAAKLIQSVSVIECTNIESIRVDQDSPACLLEFLYVGTSEFGHGAVVDAFNAASRESLKVLEMSRSGTVTGDWLREEVSKLVSLEKLGLRSCHRLDSVFIGNPKLKHLVLNCTESTLAVQVAVPGLESLSFKFRWFQPRIDIDACRSLRRVEIEGGMVLTSRMIETLVSNRSLESLTLRHFVFNGSSVPSERFHRTLTNAEIPVGMFIAHDKGTLPEVHTRLWDFLSVFGRCNTLTLPLGMRTEGCIYPEILREALNPPLMEVKELNVTDLLEPEGDDRMVELVDSLLWLAPRLHTLLVVDDRRRAMFKIKFYRANTQHGDFERKCCSSAQMKCWKHDLTGIVMENFRSYYDQERLHKYVVENVNIKVIIAFSKDLNKDSGSYRDLYFSDKKMQDRIFI